MLKKIDGFILGLLIVLGVSWLTPRSFVELWHQDIAVVCNVGISLIFFFYGLKMSKKDVTEGLGNYKLHIVVQLTTFVLFPILAFLSRPLFVQADAADFWLGFLFLCALPSTVSSSVVMVSIARGNVPAAIFNASLSGLMGVVITPIWMSMGAGAEELMKTVLSLVFSILGPVAIGLLLNKYWGHFAHKYKKKLTLFDKTVILLIVFNSFSEAFSSGIFASLTLPNILFIAVFTVSLLLLVYFLLLALSIALGFNTKDQITACFCGSKKSLMHGSVMVQAMYQSAGTQALMLLPIMIYHSVQLVIVSFIAQRYEKRQD